MQDRESECERKREHYYAHKAEYVERSRKYAETHREHISELRRVRYKKNIEKSRTARRNSKLRCEYGITIEQRDALIESQGGKCAICGEVTGLNIDYDSKLGRIRSLLCVCCSGVVQKCFGNKHLLVTVLMYIKKHNYSLVAGDEYSGA